MVVVQIHKQVLVLQYIKDVTISNQYLSYLYIMRKSLPAIWRIILIGAFIEFTNFIAFN